VLSREIFLLLFEGHLRKVPKGFLQNYIHPKAALKGISISRKGI
jgi:hypothetical protein